MTLNEAFGAIIFGIAGIAFLAWYLNCWVTMLFRCQSPCSYFSSAYESSAWFVLINSIGVVCFAAFALHWATQ